jgi:hypothetical protein
MRSVVARVAHKIPERPAIQVTVGERVIVGERDDEWPAFVFVTTAEGSGWVPERHLSRDGREAIVCEPYDTTELQTREGEVLEVITFDSLSGWIWCKAPDSREGWVPEKTV